MSVGIDSMLLIYAREVPVKPGAQSDEDASRSLRAKLLLVQLSEANETVLIPTISVSELLVPVPKNQKGALIAALQKRFVCVPFDLPAAAVAADLWAQHKQLPQDQQYTDRPLLRADTFVIASVYSAGARDFYTHDTKCRRLAGLIMNAHDLPTGQGSLGEMFIASDLRETGA